MANFLKKLFSESGNGYVLKTTALAKYNEAGVPITWSRLVSTNVMFEKKSNYPPWSQSQKVTVLIPLSDTESNVRALENAVTQIIIERIEKEGDKFSLPIRLADIQKDY